MRGTLTLNVRIHAVAASPCLPSRFLILPLLLGQLHHLFSTHLLLLLLLLLLLEIVGRRPFDFSLLGGAENSRRQPPSRRNPGWKRSMRSRHSRSRPAPLGCSQGSSRS